MVRRQSGFSMIELMVGIVIAIVVVTIVMQALAVFENQKRITTSGSDSDINGAIALFQIERDTKMAGFGMLSPNGLLCPLGINIYYNGITISDPGATPAPAPLSPIRIVDGASGGPDSIQTAGSNATYGLAPITIVKNMPNASSIVTASAPGSIQQGDMFLAGAPDGSKICTLMQASQNPQTTGNGWNLQHNPSYVWNPSNPNNVFTVAPTYVVGDVIETMGNFNISTYAVQCSDNAAPSDSNQCDLIRYNPITAGTPINWANVNLSHVATGIVDLQAQYGIAAAGDTTGTVTAWVDATGSTWAAPSAADVLRIKAIRVAIVARASKYERTAVSPSTLVLWPDTTSPAGTQKTTTLSASQQHYRYKVYYQVIPLINMIWANV
ncbi:MAG: PilW family protein [Proteobacteria bacterium]|jgi:type IV pilus assembly protein PilW|nr:PilW family protein [Pseudomonadota bacterium]